MSPYNFWQNSSPPYWNQFSIFTLLYVHPFCLTQAVWSSLTQTSPAPQNFLRLPSCPPVRSNLGFLSNKKDGTHRGNPFPFQVPSVVSIYLLGSQSAELFACNIYIDTKQTYFSSFFAHMSKSYSYVYDCFGAGPVPGPVYCPACFAAAAICWT